MANNDLAAAGASGLRAWVARGQQKAGGLASDHFPRLFRLDI